MTADDSGGAEHRGLIVLEAGCVSEGFACRKTVGLVLRTRTGRLPLKQANPESVSMVVVETETMGETSMPNRGPES